MPRRTSSRSEVVQRVTHRLQNLVSARSDLSSPPDLHVLATSSPRSVRSVVSAISVVLFAIAIFVWMNRPTIAPPEVAFQSGAPIIDPAQINEPAVSPSLILNPHQSTNLAPRVIVDVEGAVRFPGLRSLPLGSRVADAIKAAGGLRHKLPLGALNLAAKLVDGQLLVISATNVGTNTSSRAVSPTRTNMDSWSSTQSSLVNLNSASGEQLDALPGVGPVMCARILEYRNVHGSFSAVDDLQNVQGIGPKLFARLAPLVTV